MFRRWWISLRNRWQLWLLVRMEKQVERIRRYHNKQLEAKHK